MMVSAPGFIRLFQWLSDVALHVEAFDVTNRHIVRMSFSTKIIDCMDSGCAVMAICDEKQAGGAYLRRNGCAICINDLSEVAHVLRNILDNPLLLIDYQHTFRKILQGI